ncbi:geranylgeranyl transferase type-1 subunit beta-like [Daphnia pulex]|uniref:geranylgeranyl transferase type-1 subunit beta-like n=1 Tax=Daphnia pulex TaxID=6669 RepID=UPI001EDDAD05|nr:geranylgeranyl transferase type-1 subunit beta-like [Daphnia pulex]
MEKTMDDCKEFTKEKHAKYFLRCLNALPSSMVSLDSIRLSMSFFAISGLDVLGRLDLLDKHRKEYINWIYLFQILPKYGDECLERCGFRGSLAATFALESQDSSQVASIENKGSVSSHPLDTSHITMTYAAINTLLILGDDLGRIQRKGILAGVRALQLENGSFAATLEGSESDVRFVYCACCICYILQDWSVINIESATNYIVNSISYDGAIGQDRNQEGHAGLTFCGIAALSLMGTLETALSSNQKAKLVRWLVSRQQSGFQGRPNKLPVDTCYSFWVPATLKILGAHQFIDRKSNRKFVLDTQCNIIGGLSKWIDHSSDPLHSYLGLAGLSVCEETDLVEEIHPALNVTKRAFEHWQKLFDN